MRDAENRMGIQRKDTRDISDGKGCGVSHLGGLGEWTVWTAKDGTDHMVRGVHHTKVVMQTNSSLYLEWAWQMARARASAASSGRGGASRLSRRRIMSCIWRLSALP